MYEAILFDLDGTLLDTLPDIFDSMNIYLKRHHKPVLSWQKMRDYICSGSAGLIAFSFEEDMSDNKLQRHRLAFLALHEERGIIKTKIYPGVIAATTYLNQQQISWGIVTNKTETLARQACGAFDALSNYGCLVGAELPRCSNDTFSDRTPAVTELEHDDIMPLKPHPAPLIKACKLLNKEPRHCLMVGDTTHDADAAEAIGMDCVIVNYGYHQPKQPPQQWHNRVISSIDTCLIDIFHSIESS